MRILTAAASSITLTAMMLLGPTAAQAQRMQPHHIVVEKADVSTDATAHFGCEKRFFDISLNGGRVPCYGPAAIRAAYGLDALIGAGINGAGRTIVILDAYGSPTALADLQAFDAVFGLPDPPSFSIVNMPGAAATNAGWAEETSLDIQWSHAIAPGANIVLVAAASNNDADLIAGLNYALDHHLGDVVSMSFGSSEAFVTDDASRELIEAWEQAFSKAREQHVTLFVSSGDQGSTNTANDAGDVFPFPNASYPASSPQVTGVGGTNLYFGTGTLANGGRADPNGPYVSESVWNDEPQGIGAAGGGGVSTLFSMPEYQEGGLSSAVRKSLHKHRGVPDVAYNAGVVGGVIVHLGFLGTSSGFYVFGGTSAGSPQWAGVTADINQALGHKIGFLNNRLYKMGHSGALANLFHDVTDGDNGFCFFTIPSPPEDFLCIPGYSATPGWDLATGWGTPKFGTLLSLFNDMEGNDD